MVHTNIKFQDFSNYACLAGGHLEFWETLHMINGDFSVGYRLYLLNYYDTFHTKVSTQDPNAADYEPYVCTQVLYKLYTASTSVASLFHEKNMPIFQIWFLVVLPLSIILSYIVLCCLIPLSLFDWNIFLFSLPLWSRVISHLHHVK